MLTNAADLEHMILLNPDQCRDKAAHCLEAANRALYLDQRRLYGEIAEQWLLLAEQMEQRTNGRNGGQTHVWETDQQQRVSNKR
jgi:hypothetical protein